MGFDDRRRAVPELSLVLPAFNEEAGIVEVLAEARRELAARCERFEIVVVDDGSTDATPRLLEYARARLPELRVLTQPANRGYAAALARGLGAARFDPVLYTDADGQFDLADLDRALPLLAGADMVAGFRARRADPWLRRFASGGFNLLTRLLLGVRARDVDCAFKLFRRSFLERVPIESDGFLVDAEIFARARRAEQRVAQLPVAHRPRLAGRSTVRPSAVWRSARGLLELRGRLRAEDAAERARRAPAPAPSSRRFRRAAGPLLALGLALCFQGDRALYEPDEGRTAQVALGMLDSGDWSIPRLRGEPYLDKPPLTYWLVAGSLRLFGPTELAARLPHALAFAATAAVVGWLGLLLWGEATGRRAALAYALTLAPFAASNILTPDALLALAGALVAACVWRADRGGGLRFWLAAGAAAGAGLMIKGAALLVLVAPLFVALALRHRGLGWLRAPGPWAALGLAAALGLPWYVAVARELPGAAGYFVSNQVVGRLLDARYDRNPEWTSALTLYGPVLLLGSLPWPLVAAARLVRERLRTGRPRRPRPATARRAPSPETTYVLLWLVLPVAVFAVARSRLPLYLLPVFAPIALLAGRHLLQGAHRPAARFRPAVALALVWVVALVGLKASSTTRPDRRDGRAAATLVAAALPAGAAPVYAVDAALESLPFYGVRELRWATTRLDPYPAYREPVALGRSLATEHPRAVLLATTDLRLAPTLAVAEQLGYRCRERPAPDRLALIACVAQRSPESLAVAAPHRPAPKQAARAQARALRRLAHAAQRHPARHAAGAPPVSGG